MAENRARRVRELVRLASGVIAAIALGAVVVSSVVLLRRFQPDVQAAWGSHVDGRQHFTPRSWVSLHESAMNVAGVAMLIWFVTTLWLSRARSGRSLAAAIVGAIAFIATWTTNASWSHVRWNQVALWRVTVGTNYSGFWRPAVSDQVRFMIVDHSEVSQQAYLVALLIHLAAPVIALLGLGISTYLTRRRATPPARLPSDEFGGEVVRS